MNLLHDRPKVTDIPPPGTDVLIEEVRRHYRRRLLATAIVCWHSLVLLAA